MTFDIPIYMAFIAGLISFLSPCVLPLVPGYISFISGVSPEKVAGSKELINVERREQSLILLNSIFFILGFSGVFILLGASATWIGGFFTSEISFFTKIAGLVIIFFGIFKMGLIRSLFFHRQVSFKLKNRRFGLLGAITIGASFAFGWTPCIGPILGSIMTYAATLEKVNQGLVLLLFYSLGMGLPFFVAACFINHFFRFFDRIKSHMDLIEKISGLILIIVGLLIFFNKLILIPGYLSFLNGFVL